MVRSLPFSPSLVQANQIDWSYFVRVDVPSPVGTKRFTDRYLGDYTGNIDGSGSQLWTYADLEVSGIDQSDQNTLSVTQLSVWNLDTTWTTWAQSPGLKNATVEVRVAWFNLDQSFAGSYIAYEGSIDNAEYGPRALMALKPHHTPWSRQAPWKTGAELGAGPLIPAQNVTVNIGDTLARVA